MPARITLPSLSATTLQRARSLRTNASKVERKLWHALRGRAFADCKFRRQFPIAGYITDFCCVELKLIIEIDGAQHDRTLRYDKQRTRDLASHGFRVIRFTAAEALGDIEAVRARILEVVEGSE